MIKLSNVSIGIASSAGTNIYASCIEVPMIYGGNASMPQISVSFSYNTPIANSGSVIIPCYATISLKYVDGQGNVSRQQELVEYFDIGIAGTAVPASIVLSNLGQQFTYTKTKCCRSYGIRLDGAFSLTTTAS